MSLFGIKKDVYDGSGLVTFRNYANNLYLSIDRAGNVSTIKIIETAEIGNNETLSLVNMDLKKDANDNIFYIRSYYGHYLTFDVSDTKLRTQKVSYSMTPWRKHTSQVYARFSSDDLFYFTPSSTAGIIGASFGLSLYGNNFLSSDSNGTVCNKIIPGKHEMWILSYIKRNQSPNNTVSLQSAASKPKPIIIKPVSPPLIHNNDHKQENDEKTESFYKIRSIDDSKRHFDEQLFVISNLVESNSKALDIYRQQIDNKTIKVNTMKEWDKLYKRVSMKKKQWDSHKMSLNNDDMDLCECLNNKYNNKWGELEELKESLIRENNTLNKLNEAKENTSVLLTHCNDEIKAYDDEIDRLELKIKELKQKRSQCWSQMNDQIIPKLNVQSECIMDKMDDVDRRSTAKNNLEKEMTSIQETKHQINKFEKDIIYIITFLQNKFKRDFQQKWMKWSTNDIVIWLQFLNIMYGDIAEFKFKNEDNKQLLLYGVTSSKMEGKDLKNINDLILRSWDIKQKEDRDMILTALKLLMNEMKQDDDVDGNDNDNHIDDRKECIEDQEQQDRQCVVCMDNAANMMFMPCNHIALCQGCYASNTFDKCAFCGNECVKVIKCYHVGF